MNVDKRMFHQTIGEALFPPKLTIKWLLCSHFTKLTLKFLPLSQLFFHVYTYSKEKFLFCRLEGNRIFSHKITFSFCHPNIRFTAGCLCLNRWLFIAFLGLFALNESIQEISRKIQGWLIFSCHDFTSDISVTTLCRALKAFLASSDWDVNQGHV